MQAWVAALPSANSLAEHSGHYTQAMIGQGLSSVLNTKLLPALLSGSVPVMTDASVLVDAVHTYHMHIMSEQGWVIS
jgi:hypothetical protein